MASIITQSIGAAAATVTQQSQSAQTTRDQVARPITQDQVQRASQEAVRSITQNLKNNGNNKSIQTPPRVESSFQSQRDKEVKKEKGDGSPETQETEAPERRSRVVA